MKRLIYASYSPGTLIKKVGKYLNDVIDGTYKIAFHPMECEIFMRMYYQIPNVKESFDEMKFIISVTSYQNKLRINLTEDDEYEKTIGQLILFPEELTDLPIVRKRVLQMIKKAISKEFREFDFIY
jgi:hypothetical protein